MHLLLTVFALLPAIATLSAATSLQPRADTCPDNQRNVNINNKHYCCPGSVISAGNDDGYCCVDGDVAVPTVCRRPFHNITYSITLFGITRYPHLNP